jgi:hypothetical protein
VWFWLVPLPQVAHLQIPIIPNLFLQIYASYLSL